MGKVMTVLLLLLSLVPGLAGAEESDWRARMRAEATQGERLSDLGPTFFMGTTQEESRTDCVGDLTQPHCVAETALACRTWNDKALCESISGENHRRDWTRWEEPMFDPSPPYQGAFLYSYDRPQGIYDARNAPPSFLDNEVLYWPTYLLLRGTRANDRRYAFTRYICWPSLPCPEEGSLYAMNCSDGFCSTNPLAIGLTIVTIRETDDGAWAVRDVMEQHFEAYEWMVQPTRPGALQTHWNPACNGLPMTAYCAALRNSACNAEWRAKAGQETATFFGYEMGRCLAGYTNPSTAYEFVPGEWFHALVPVSPQMLSSRFRLPSDDYWYWARLRVDAPSSIYRSGDMIYQSTNCIDYQSADCSRKLRTGNGALISGLVLRQVPDGTWHVVGTILWFFYGSL